MSADSWALHPDAKPQVTAKTPHKPPLAAIRQRVQGRRRSRRVGAEARCVSSATGASKAPSLCGGPYPAAAMAARREHPLPRTGGKRMSTDTTTATCGYWVGPIWKLDGETCVCALPAEHGGGWHECTCGSTFAVGIVGHPPYRRPDTP